MKTGFTLVELSIVLVIIGLLIGGILVGQSMIDNAKLKRAMSELIQYQIMIKQFSEKFKGLPGDMNGYKYFGDACGGNHVTVSTGNSACNGNQNGVIEPAQSESLLLWRHMYFGGYLDTAYAQNWNLSDPAFVAGQNMLGADVFNKGALYYPIGGGLNDFVIRIAMNNAGNIDHPNGAAISGEDIVALEAKYDDGVANAGFISGGNASPTIFSQPDCLQSASVYAFAANPEYYHDTGCFMHVGFIAY